MNFRKHTFYTNINRGDKYVVIKSLLIIPFYQLFNYYPQKYKVAKLND